MAWYEDDLAGLQWTTIGDCRISTARQVPYRGGMVSAQNLAFAAFRSGDDLPRKFEEAGFVCDDEYPATWPTAVSTCGSPNCLEHLRPLPSITGDKVNLSHSRRYPHAFSS
jgi:hypothetical protein